MLTAQCLIADDSLRESNPALANDEAIYFFAPGPVMGFYYFEYQKALAPRHSVNLAAEYADFRYEGNPMIRLWGIYRYKINQNDKGPLHGVFLTPAIQLAQPLDGADTIVNTLFYLSYQHVYATGFSVQYFAGLGYGFSLHAAEQYKMYTGLSPSSGISLGFTF